MNERCSIAFADPIARAEGKAPDKFWRGYILEGRHLSTIVTLNK